MEPHVIHENGNFSASMFRTDGPCLVYTTGIEVYWKMGPILEVDDIRISIAENGSVLMYLHAINKEKVL